MTNCDLDELRYQALQKFVELADEKWKSYNDNFLFNSLQFTHGKYDLRYDHASGHVWVLLGQESLGSKSRPIMRPVKRTKTGKPNKSDLKKVEEEHKAALEKYNTDPVVAAAKKIYERWYTAKCKAQEEQMKRDMEESCKRLQQEMSTIDKSNERAEIAASSCLTVDRPWWRRLWP